MDGEALVKAVAQVHVAKLLNLEPEEVAILTVKDHVKVDVSLEAEDPLETLTLDLGLLITFSTAEGRQRLWTTRTLLELLQTLRILEEASLGAAELPMRVTPVEEAWALLPPAAPTEAALEAPKA